MGFLGGAVVENLPVNAGDTGSSPDLGRSHMPRSNRAREPQLLSLRVWSLCSATREAAIVRGLHTAMKSGPRLPQREKALAFVSQKRGPNTAKLLPYLPNWSPSFQLAFPQSILHFAARVICQKHEFYHFSV